MKMSYGHQACIYLIKNLKKYSIVKILLQFKRMYFNILKNIIYFCDAVLNFQHHY